MICSRRNHWGTEERLLPKFGWDMLLLPASFHFKQTFGMNRLQTASVQILPLFWTCKVNKLSDSWGLGFVSALLAVSQLNGLNSPTEAPWPMTIGCVPQSRWDLSYRLELRAFTMHSTIPLHFSKPSTIPDNTVCNKNWIISRPLHIDIHLKVVWCLS